MGGINDMLQKQDMIKNRKSVDRGLGSSLYKTLKLTRKLAVLGVKKLQNLNESGEEIRALLSLFPYL